MSDYVIFVPQIDSAAITPNPIEANASLKISVVVSEIQKVLYPEWYYSARSIPGKARDKWR